MIESLRQLTFSSFLTSRLIAQVFLFGFSLLRFVFWWITLFVFNLPYQTRAVFTPKRNGSVPVSRFFRKVFEYKKIKPTIGLGLMFVIFLANFFSVQVSAYDKAEEQSVLDKPDEVLLTTQTTFRMPVPGFISSSFSWWHPGIDLAGNDNRLVYAAADGQVIEASYSNWGYGNTIVVDHGNNLITRYAHLQGDIRVKVGNKVFKSTALGRVGSTGWSTGPHLHFEIWENGQALNPLLALPEVI